MGGLILFVLSKRERRAPVLYWRQRGVSKRLGPANKMAAMRGSCIGNGAMQPRNSKSKAFAAHHRQRNSLHVMSRGNKAPLVAAR